jgi:hypothetical protein
MGAPYLGVTCGLTVALTSTVWPRVLDFLSPYNAKGVARMSDINLALPLPTTLVLFGPATSGVGPLRCCGPSGQTGCRQSVQQ